MDEMTPMLDIGYLQQQEEPILLNMYHAAVIRYTFYYMDFSICQICEQVHKNYDYKLKGDTQHFLQDLCGWYAINQYYPEYSHFACVCTLRMYTHVQYKV